ncbi:MAG: hypothetical protein ACRYFZ_11450 [Janthinobacterium lividum]
MAIAGPPARVARPRPAPDQRPPGQPGGKPAALADWPAPAYP